jgi:hypothetical protein
MTRSELMPPYYWRYLTLSRTAMVKLMSDGWWSQLTSAWIRVVEAMLVLYPWMFVTVLYSPMCEVVLPDLDTTATRRIAEPIRVLSHMCKSGPGYVAMGRCGNPSCLALEPQQDQG